VETELNLVQYNFFRTADEAMRLHGQRGVALAREHGLSGPLARLLDWLALAEVICGNWPEARDYAKEARALNAARGDRVAEGGNLTELAGALVRLGETRAAVEAARTAYTIAGETNHEMARASAAKELALGLLDAGDWAGALDVAQAGLAAARLAGYPPMLIMVMAVAGRVQRVIGAPEAATAIHDEAWALQGMIGSPMLAHLIATELSTDRASAGDWEAATEWLRRALALRDYRTLFLGLDHQLETEVLLRAGDAETALADLEHFGAKIGANHRYRLPYLRARAIVATWLGEAGEAIGYLEEAAELAASLDLPGERWEILATLGAAWQAQGDAGRAGDAYATAAAIVSALAAGLPTEAARDHFLASPGVRAVLAAGGVAS
jgi:tetratricopeptide (TPR) repeat protein